MMKYYIKTFGCQMNFSDSERIAGFLESLNFKPLSKNNKADLSVEALAKTDLIIFNTCGVRQTAEDRVYGQIHNLKTKNCKPKTIILTGCLAGRKDVQRRLKDKVDLFIEIKDFPRLFSPFKKGKAREGFEEMLKSLGLQIPLNPPFPKEEKCDYLSIIPKYTNKKTAFVPIMTGCNNFCSYCVVPYARGREYSRPMEDIIEEVDKLAEKGCKEITLLGQNVNSYSYQMQSAKCLPTLLCKALRAGKVQNYSLKFKIIKFPVLLNHLANSYPNIKFKFLTSHPKDFSDDLIKVISQNKNISREIHLPIQSGSNKILRLMNRPYTQKKYLDLIKKIKKAIPDTTFTTDVIVGFPGETLKDFQETIKVFKIVNYNEAYINKYSPRPRTSAWKLGNPISWEEKKRREKILRNILVKCHSERSRGI